MLVYGDAASRVRVADALQSIAATWREGSAMSGLERRERLMNAFVAASGLVQGLLDAEFEQRDADDLTPLHTAGMRLLAALGADLVAATGSGAEAMSDLASMPLAD